MRFLQGVSASQPVLTDLTVSISFAGRFFCADVDGSALSGRRKAASPSCWMFGKWVSMLLERTYCSALRSGLNSFPKSLNMSHNHLVMPKRKSESLLLPVPAIRASPVPLTPLPLQGCLKGPDQMGFTTERTACRGETM